MGQLGAAEAVAEQVAEGRSRGACVLFSRLYMKVLLSWLGFKF